MRVAIVTESFLPQINGVTHSIMRVTEHLRQLGHDALILAPSDEMVPTSYAGFPVMTIPSIALPMYQDVRLSMTPGFVLDRLLTDFAPDVMHVAAPFLLGSAGLAAAARLSIPSVAIYQTDVASYAAHYGLGLMEQVAWTRIRDIHSLATLTLAPSTYACEQLNAHDIPRVKLWGRGVDTTRFSPTRREPVLHDEWAPEGQVVIGYMGRLAAEKQVEDLAKLADLPGATQVIVGAGPTRRSVKKHLPTARFLGKLTGDDLPRATATMDIFVHPGELETFGQSIQEALASGLPVVAPRRGGPIDLIEHGRWGFLYPPGDLDQMRQYVAQLVEDPALRQRFSQAARDFTSRRTWPHICDQLLDYYRQAMALTAGAAPDPR